ncbi:IS30 family transposase [Clostridium felsineum]|uniref:IS30 family transposase ISSmi1 n=1 Tax=Clostridium felsineum TaxID=36839 RepID=A0A1S8KX10_9CLOT|nr:IS30 family transposase [Clostridium felsineum]URZ05546.1 IS30 family transposase ISSmi1 [Clostridium felsineum]URZ05564.1 IS30 family transposase ISSmi1 [Clostridium felsineum]URZ10579.1 IS30 family transposase ISSmi1 [Clostridium felsineum]URZ10585.1 IS30 family transposase ISSmi1 [Clostridium felsineum]URZ10603.1 IS30 family transposase ISSmi1 [Clostridium felsineum]
MSNYDYDGKHLSTTQRIKIEKGLIDAQSFASIARTIGKHPSTVSKEVKKYRYFPERNEPKNLITCARKKICQLRFLCDKKDCVKLCKFCYSADCNRDCRTICPAYESTICSKIKKAPYVCNGCSKFKRCNLQHAIYSAQQADESSHDLLVSCRDGINQSPADIAMLDNLISPLLKQGQSLAHIYSNHGHEIPCSRRTLYHYIDKGVFEARNIDLRRRVRYKCKERKTATRISLAAREFRINRTYDDFKELLKKAPTTPVVELDTVEGGRGNSTQVFLTMLFRNCSLMLIFVLKEKTQDCVIEIFDTLSEELGIDTFKELFPIILTDNGIEFQWPQRIECNANGEIRTRVYYCNPNSSWQKGMIEKNHEYIRYVIPKGQSLDLYTQDDATLLMNHINSEARDSLNGCNPFKLSLLLLNNKLHKLLHLKEIPSDDVTLQPRLLKK